MQRWTRQDGPAAWGSGAQERRRIGVRLAAALLGVAGALLLCELLLRVAYLSPAQWVLDSALGQTRAPHSLVFDAGEGGAALRFDRYGLNNEDAVWDRPGPRVALVGDSYVEAEQVPRERNFASLLAQAWPDRVVLNLGRYGLSPPQMLALTRRLTAREHMDLLVLHLSDADVGDLEKAPPAPGCLLPEQTLGWRRRLIATLVRHSVLLQRLQLRARAWWNATRAELGGLAMTLRGDSAAPPLAEEALTAMLAECIDAFAAEAAAALVLLPGDRLEGAEDAEAERHLRILHAAAARSRIALIVDARHALGADPLGDGRMVLGFANHVLGEGHMNPLGHAALARLLASRLRQALPAGIVEIAGAQPPATDTRQ